MRRIKLSKARLILISALIATVLPLAAAAQTNSASGFSATAPVQSGVSSSVPPSFVRRDDTPCDTVEKCLAVIAITEQRLLKSLDALAASEALVGLKNIEIDARKRLDDLKNDLLAVKDQYIKDVLADNAFLRGQRDSVKSKLRKFFDTVTKIALVAAGIYIGVASR